MNEKINGSNCNDVEGRFGTYTLEELFPSSSTDTAMSLISSNSSPVSPSLSPQETLDDLETEITVVETQTTLLGKKGKLSAASDPDGITKNIWKAVPDPFITELCNLYKRCLKEGKFPPIWKIAKLILIAKPTDFLQVKYRPICLFDEAGKALERIIGSRLKKHLHCSDATLSDSQFGFREGRSTVDSLNKAKVIINNACRENKYIIAVSLDIKNAFNSLSWSSIIRHLKRKNTPGYFLNIIQDYLSERNIIYKEAGGQIHSRKVVARSPAGICSWSTFLDNNI